MQAKRKRHPRIVLLVIGLTLTLAACNVKSDVLTPSVMTDDEMATLIWHMPGSPITDIDQELDKIYEENPDMTLKEEQTLVKQLLTEQMAKLPENERAALQQKLREDSELQN